MNTLILAYAGASLGLFVFFVLNPNNTPVWVMVNNEMVAEEIVRAVVGSTGLILAVPITTIIASYVAKNISNNILSRMRRCSLNETSGCLSRRRVHSRVKRVSSSL